MPDGLRTATPSGDWRSFKFEVESGGVLNFDDARTASSSALYRVGDTVGMSLYTKDAGDESVLVYHAEKIMVPKKTGSGEEFTQRGQRVYWDPADRMVTPNFASGRLWIGINTELADTTDEYVEIDLDGNHAEIEAAI